MYPLTFKIIPGLQYNISALNSHDFVFNPLVDTKYYFNAEKKKGCFVFDTLTLSVNHSPRIFLGAKIALAVINRNTKEL
jgi:hypothetical protein